MTSPKDEMNEEYRCVLCEGEAVQCDVCRIETAALARVTIRPKDEAVTEAMYEAGYAAWQEQDTNGVQLWRADFAAIYTAMRDAAPVADEEQVERVARALRDVEWGQAGTWDEADEADREYWRKSARAAITALSAGGAGTPEEGK